MNPNLANLLDPFWWLTLIPPTAAALLAPLGWRLFIGRLKLFGRAQRYKLMQRVRSVRHDDVLVTSLTLRAQSSFLVFVMCVVALVMLLVLSPFTAGPKAILFVFLLSIPVLASEAVWLHRDHLARAALKSRARLKRRVLPKELR
jgi:ABC-type multidrug transport system fused ATPase/permease subunit